MTCVGSRCSRKKLANCEDSVFDDISALSVPSCDFDVPEKLVKRLGLVKAGED
jgi:hypothetical protein